MDETKSDAAPPAEQPVEQQTEPPRMTDEELREFVLGACDNRIFTSAHVPAEDTLSLQTIFMPLVFGALANESEQYLKQVGVIWEYLSEAGPMAVNGYPTFFSMRIMHVEDWRRASEAIRAEQQRRKNIPV